MVKRVLSKINAERESEKAKSTRKTLPPPGAKPSKPRKPPSANDTSPGIDLKVTVDQIDRERFLTALKNSPSIQTGKAQSPSAPARPVSQKPSSSSGDSGAGGVPASQEKTVKTTVELAEPVVADESLTQMSDRKLLSDATDKLFASHPTEDKKADPDSNKDDTVDIVPKASAAGGGPAIVPVATPQSVESEHGGDVFRHLEGNLMEINFSGKVFIKQGTIYSYSGNLTFWVKPQRQESTSPLVIVSGTGRLLLTDRQRKIKVMQINGEEVFVEPSHLLACQETLIPRYGVVKKQDADSPQLHVLAIEGTGKLALSVATSPLVLTVTPGYPINVSSDNIICWSGKLTPTIIEDEVLSEMMSPRTGMALNVRLEGTGQVMIEKRGQA